MSAQLRLIDAEAHANPPPTFWDHLVMSKVCMAEPISIMIFGDVFDRFPTLRFGSIASVCMDRNVWGSFIRDTVGVQNRNLPGGRNIMWSTDYPHSETT